MSHLHSKFIPKNKFPDRLDSCPQLSRQALCNWV